MAGFNMDDYVPVNERVERFLEKWPDGCLQSEIVELTDSRVTVKAYAYRTAEDARPGVGHSSLEIPGKTTFTRGSEIENAETSAWGRAIAALGFEVKRGIASAEEARNKQPEQGRATVAGRRQSAHPASAPVQPSRYRRDELAELMATFGLDNAAVDAIANRIGIPKGERPMSDASMDLLIEAIQQPSNGSAHPETALGEVGEHPTSPDALLESVLEVTGGELVQPSSEAVAEDSASEVDAGSAAPPTASPRPRTVEEAIADAEAKATKAKVPA